MNYEEAASIIAEHQTNYNKSSGVVKQKVDPTRKKLCNVTWLIKEQQSMTLLRPRGAKYFLEVFGKRIVEYGDEYVALNDKGWFAWTTHDRWNRFLPRGFRVSGCSHPKLRQTDFKTIGEIRTPAGTFPYKMPCSFTYDGRAYDMTRGKTGYGPTDRAQEAVAELPAYVDAYLDQMLRHPPHWRGLHFNTQTGLTPDEDEGSRSLNAEQYILERKFNPRLLTMATHVGGSILGFPIEEVAKVLLSDSYKAFSPAQHGHERLERTAFHKKALPDIPYAAMRKELRIYLMNFFMQALGYQSDITWNERDR